jgi:hypothetical protein
LVLVEELDIDEVSNICCFKKKNLFGWQCQKTWIVKPIVIRHS